MVRKKYSRRKRRTTLLALSFPTCFWASGYLKERQFIRFYQALGLVPVQAFSASLVVFDRKRTSLAHSTNLGVSSLAISRTILSHFISKSSGSDFLSPRLSPSSCTMLATLSVPAMSSVSEACPVAVYDDRVMFPIDTNLSLLDTGVTLAALEEAVFRASTGSLSTIRSLLIYITLLNICPKELPHVNLGQP
jgi:hypothetical protein